MLEHLSDDENDLFRNDWEKSDTQTNISKACDSQGDPSYTEFKPVVNKSFMVSVDNPEKMGDGMSSYVAYHVHFRGLAPPFLGITSSIVRRFSDFIHIHEQLVAKYMPKGIIVPPAPGKELLDTTRLKFSKNIYLENEFVERRRFALKRFLSRLFYHPVISSDKDLLDFIQQSGPPRNSSQLLSSSSAKRLMKNIGDAFVKASYQISDADDYFFAKTQELTDWERQLKQLRSGLTALVTAQQELASTKVTMSQALTSLANVEENTELARALSRLSETEEQIGQVEATLANSQMLHLVECVVDILDLIQASRDTLAERVKVHRSWQYSIEQLRSKRESKVKLELSGKAERKKLDQLDAEIEGLRDRVAQEENYFKEFSETVQSELERFDVDRVIYIKKVAVKHLEVMLCAQSKVQEYWETFRNHAYSIA